MAVLQRLHCTSLRNANRETLCCAITQQSLLRHNLVETCHRENKRKYKKSRSHIFVKSLNYSLNQTHRSMTTNQQNLNVHIIGLFQIIINTKYLFSKIYTFACYSIHYIITILLFWNNGLIMYQRNDENICSVNSTNLSISCKGLKVKKKNQ